MQRNLSCYVCDECDHHLTQCQNAILCWKSTVREIEGKVRHTRGCVVSREQVPLYCNKHVQSTGSNGSRTGAQFNFECCQENLCNSGKFPTLQDISTSGTSGSMTALKIIMQILAPVIFLSFLVGGVLLFLRYQKIKKKRHGLRQTQKLLEAGLDNASVPTLTAPSIGGGTGSGTGTNYELRAIAAGDSTLKEYLEGQSLTSGSGSGLPLLVQRTLAKQITLTDCLSSGGSGGVGSFGREIWRGIWHGETVAVKIYFTRDEVKWARETEVYSQFLPRHDNILGYIGSDMTSRASCTQLWLVTHYHPLGSLQRFLSQVPQPMGYHQMFNICLSVTNGLVHLHTDINGTKGKTAMALRNLTSKNILVKNNGACVIADFSQAVTLDRLANDKFDIKQGSKRYLSPELLEQSYDPQCLEGFRRADVYALGLIFWEVCRRCLSNGVALDYAAPYSEWLANGNQEPSLEEMRKLVVQDQRRPPIPNRWHSDQTLMGIGAMMKECWHTKAAARLPILRVKKTLVKLASNNPDVDLPLD